MRDAGSRAVERSSGPYRGAPNHIQGLLFWLFKGAFKVSSGTVNKWYRSSSGTDFDSSEIASPHMDHVLRYTMVIHTSCILL